MAGPDSKPKHRTRVQDNRKSQALDLLAMGAEPVAVPDGTLQSPAPVSGGGIQRSLSKGAHPIPEKQFQSYPRSSRLRPGNDLRVRYWIPVAVPAGLQQIQIDNETDRDGISLPGEDGRLR